MDFTEKAMAVDPANITHGGIIFYSLRTFITMIYENA